MPLSYHVRRLRACCAHVVCGCVMGLGCFCGIGNASSCRMPLLKNVAHVCVCVCWSGCQAQVCRAVQGVREVYTAPRLAQNSALFCRVRPCPKLHIHGTLRAYVCVPQPGGLCDRDYVRVHRPHSSCDGARTCVCVCVCAVVGGGGGGGWGALSTCTGCPVHDVLFLINVCFFCFCFCFFFGCSLSVFRYQSAAPTCVSAALFLARGSTRTNNDNTHRNANDDVQHMQKKIQTTHS